jgi:hypothetical protein
VLQLQWRVFPRFRSRRHPPGGSLPEIIYAEVDVGIVQRVRASMPVIDHERPAAYCFDPEHRAAA